jgi:IS30 family transposase
VPRELARNGGRSRYRAQRADAAADRRAARPKPAKLAVAPRLRAVVESKLGLRWSPDLVLGKRPSAVLKLVERTSRSVVLVALPAGWRADQVRSALTAAMKQLPRSLCRSLTWDHGKEMAEHARFTADTGIPVYFCEPRSPGNGPATRTPTGWSANTCPGPPTLRRFSQADLDRITAELNGRPRQLLGFQTPSRVLAAALR